MAPFAPFLPDELYLSLTGADLYDVSASVHLSDFPVAREADKDPALEERMELVRQVVSLGRGVREKERLKVRQPLARILIDSAHEPLLGGMTDLIMDELNVKEVVFLAEVADYMNYEIKPDFKAAGPVFGKDVKAFAAALAAMSPVEAAELAAAVQGEGADRVALIMVGGREVSVTADLLDIRVNAKEGFAVAMEGGVFVIIDTALTDGLVQEGIVREFVSKVQQLRKQKGLEMMDRIEIYYESDKEVDEAVVKWAAYILSETLANEVGRPGYIMKEEQPGEIVPIIYESDGVRDPGGWAENEAFDLNGHEARIRLQKV
jgi:isoleucyl-tRNA synthetase